MLARGVTFLAAAGDLTLPWLRSLGDFFLVSCSPDGAEQPLPPNSLDLSVHLQACLFYSSLVFALKRMRHQWDAYLIDIKLWLPPRLCGQSCF